MILTFFTYAIVGGFAGLLAGLLGVGGGIVIVPALVFCYTRSGFDSSLIMHLALGTSMASIVFTSIASCLGHHRNGMILWPLVKKSIFGLILGTIIGTFFATETSTLILKNFFAIFLYLVSIYLLFRNNLKSFNKQLSKYSLFCITILIGFLSSLVGIGGGIISVPLMTLFKVKMHNAIATSAAIGCPIAIAGTIGYIWRGINVSNLPSNSLGYVYFPALTSIVLISFITALLGAKIAHNLQVDRLRYLFSILILLVGTKMLLTLL